MPFQPHTLRRYNGSEWEAVALKRYNGSIWELAQLHREDGGIVSGNETLSNVGPDVANVTLSVSGYSPNHSSETLTTDGPDVSNASITASSAAGGGRTLPVYQGQNTWSTNASTPGAAINVPLPTEVATDDYVLVGISCDASASPTTPTGWTLHGNDDDRRFFYGKLYEVADGSNFTITIPHGTSQKQAAVTTCYADVDTTTPIDVTGTMTADAGSPQTAPGVTTVEDNSMLITFSGTRASSNGITDFTSSSGYTERAEVVAGTGGAVCSAWLSEKAQATAGSSGDHSITLTGTTGSGGCQIVALRGSS